MRDCSSEVIVFSWEHTNSTDHYLAHSVDSQVPGPKIFAAKNRLCKMNLYARRFFWTPLWFLCREWSRSVWPGTTSVISRTRFADGTMSSRSSPSRGSAEARPALLLTSVQVWLCHLYSNKCTHTDIILHNKNVTLCKLFFLILLNLES